MRTIPVNLKTHQAAEVTTLATLWKCVLTNGTTLGFTDHDLDITYSGVTYAAATGFNRSAIKDTAALNVDNLEVQGMLTSPAITEADLLAGLWDHAHITVMRINWASVSDGVEILRTGRIGEVSTGSGVFTAEMRGLMQSLQNNLLEVMQPGCRADLGDARCGVSLGSWTVTGSVEGVADNRIISDSSRVEVDDYYLGGKITFTSGANNGLSMEVKAYTTGSIELQLSMPYTIALTDTYSLHAGCDKSLATCRDRFSNLVNFRGEPYLPGTDRMIGGQ